MATASTARRHWGRLVAAVGLVWGLAGAGAAPAAADGAGTARDVLAASRITGGLVAHLGCGDGRLTVALRASGRFLVHGLETDPLKVAAARAYIRSLGVYGKVAVESWQGERLPYADNTVNLLVDESDGRVAEGEILRVLVPQGVACRRTGDGWTTRAKPRPANVDEWTHFLHDASGNAVAHDEVVGPPRRLQWSAGPGHALNHEFTPSTAAVVSGGGRVVYICDEAPIASILRPPQWSLVARDAYNGLFLWRRPVPVWWPHLFGWTGGPRQLQRRVVVAGDRVYVTLGLYAPVSELDAASGETLRVFEQTAGTDEIVVHGGVLLLAVRAVTAARTAELGRWEALAAEPNSPLRLRDTRAPIEQALRQADGEAGVSVLALDVATGGTLWQKPGPAGAKLRPLTLCALADRALYQAGGTIVCVDLRTGAERWTTVSAGPLRTLSAKGLVCADGKAVTVLSPETGAVLWTREPALREVRDAFVIGDSLWLGGFRAFDTGNAKHTGPVWGPYFATRHSLATGDLQQQIEPENPLHHHRCYPNKATDRFILGGRRGTEFLDLHSGEVFWNSWARGVCMYGVMPANGLLYVPPHACGCYATVRLIGFSALAGGPPSPPAVVDPALEKGPAYAGTAGTAGAAADPGAWPTFRADAGRSGSTRTEVPVALHRLWQTTVGGQLTAPVVAGGKVFVASPEDHRLVAVAADSGRPAWESTAGGRIDSPPTVADGRVLFGCHDGYLYCLRAADGAAAWRLRVARDERRIVAEEQLESVSPVPGSVLVRDGVACVTAGRSSYLDGGIDLCRVRAAAGDLLSRTPIYSPDPETGRQPAQYGPSAMPGARADVLSGDDQYVYLRDQVFAADGSSRPEGNPHLFTVTGFLDGTWPHRSYWIFGSRLSLATGCSGRDKALLFGRLLVFDDTLVYGYGRKSVHWSSALEDGPTRLFAFDRKAGTERWATPLPIVVRAMVLAGPVLFLAGPRTAAGATAATVAQPQGALLLAVSAADGRELARLPLAAEPAFDSLVAAYGRLYLATSDGHLQCFAGEQR